MGISVPQIQSYLPYNLCYQSSNIIGAQGWFGLVTSVPSTSQYQLTNPTYFYYDVCTADGTPISFNTIYTTSGNQTRSQHQCQCTYLGAGEPCVALDDIVAIFSYDGLDDYIINPTSTSSIITNRYAFDCTLDAYYYHEGLLYTAFTFAESLFQGYSFYTIQAAPNFTATLQVGAHYIVYLSRYNITDIIDWRAVYANAADADMYISVDYSSSSTTAPWSCISVMPLTHTASDPSYRAYLPTSTVEVLRSSVGVTSLVGYYLKAKPFTYTTHVRFTYSS